MLRSMTGFGVATGPVGEAQVTIELRSVNHRFFSPAVKLPLSLARWEGEIRERLRRRIARGHVTLTARVDRSAADDAVVDEGRFAAYVSQLRALQQRYDLAEPLDVATILRLPNVLGGDGGDEPEGSAEEVLAVVDVAAAALIAMREAEGARMAAVLLERVDVAADSMERIAARAPERLAAECERLRRAVRELADGVGLDEARLAQEIAVLADRLDVSEEIDRFRAHVAAFRGAVMNAGAEPVGKRLSFLLQEMVREANTTGSKAKDAVMTHEVVAVKEELERLAEQVENVE
jgi:uncharacterized protein (TIGR00255 family)